MHRGKVTIQTAAVLILSLALNAQTNPGFESGIDGWVTEDQQAIRLVADNVYQGKTAISIGPGNAGLWQRVSMAPLSLVECKVYSKPSDTGTTGFYFIRFFDSTGRQILEYKSKLSAALGYTQTGHYTESPANTKYIQLGIQKTSGNGYIYADEFSLETNMGEAKVKPTPLVSLEEYMRPFWTTDTIHNETVLLYSLGGQPASGNLLFKPDKILSVKSFDLKTVFRSGIDYTMEANTITRKQQSPIPFRADTSFDQKNNLAWYDLQSQWILVSYIHHDPWAGPKLLFNGGQMPNTMTRLKTKRPLNIVAYGMSITRGMNVSGYDAKPPYMPTYLEMFAGELKKRSHDDQVHFFNAGLPGAKIDWGAKYVNEYVNGLNPDLVILDFGMNDFWSISPEEFKGYMQEMIKRIRKANPKTEIILLSNMKFDPEYVLQSDPNRNFYLNNMIGYNKVLQSLQTVGIVDLDMTTISDYLHQKKKAKDCLTNPLHPNDYMARWYAQALVALFVKTK